MIKRILLVTPNFFKLDEMIRQNLAFAGFEVTAAIYDLEKPFAYRNKGQKLRNWYEKKFKGNRDFKFSLVKQNNNDELRAEIEKFPRAYFDAALFLVVQFFDEALIAAARKVSKKMVAYQFDTIRRTPDLVPRIKLFDRFFSFEKSDVLAFGVESSHNFFFDFNVGQPRKKEIDFFYLGTFVPQRMAALLRITEMIRKCGFTHKIMLFSHDREPLKAYADAGFEFPDRLLTYEEQEDIATRARVLIDLKLEVHDGLSFRFFEAMKFRCKVLTTNSSVEQYDFYSPDNILIAPQGSISEAELKRFVELPFNGEKKETFRQYAFTNWLNKILS